MPWPAAIAVTIVVAAISGTLSPLFVDWVRGRKPARLERANKAQLHEMLSGETFRIRSLETLMRATGTSDEECRRLLRGIGARGVTLKSGKEGWKLLEQPPGPDPG